MTRGRSRRTSLRRPPSRLPAGVAVACLLAGCGVLSLEEQLLQRFFEASRTYDRVALEKVAAAGVVYNPVTNGVVDGFTVVDVVESGGRRTVRVEATVRMDGSTRRQPLQAVVERRDEGWRITSLMPLPASRTAP
jgi:hypothetical protein